MDYNNKKKKKKTIHIVIKSDPVIEKWIKVQKKNTASIKNLIHFFADNYGYIDISKIDSIIQKENTVLNQNLSSIEEKLQILLDRNILNIGIDNTKTENVVQTSQVTENEEFNKMQEEKILEVQNEENETGNEKEVEEKKEKQIISKKMLDSLL